MATLVLTALGTAVGGPIGGAIGAVLGRQADQAVFGSGNRTGPRLKELAVTTSSYGQPIPRQFGRMRTAGTIIWATDLVETRSTEGGGKGQPSTTTYSYSASFAVAVSSTPISKVQRVWADGKLLCGSAGDLKVEGSMRTYRGFGDDPVDPLIAADTGSDAPGFRDFAYVVFEDLKLADFGNRIPALTFEVIGQDEDRVRMDRILPQIASEAEGVLVPHARGLVDEGGPIASTFAAIDEVYPLAVSLAGDRVRLSAQAEVPDPIPCLAEELASARRGRDIERRKHRGDRLDRQPMALRYYDEARDYQPGVQRAVGERPEGRENIVDLPATLHADDAKILANANANRARWTNERRSWLCSALDPALGPGSIVCLPDAAGAWIVRTWEWFERGIELGLERLPPDFDDRARGDAGSILPAQDREIPETLLEAFELPPDGSGAADWPSVYIAASASSSAWRGATIFAERGDSLTEIGKSGSARATIGTLAEDLPASQFHVMDHGTSLMLEVHNEDSFFPTTDFMGLANGANRLLVGGEVLQYLFAERTGSTEWTLRGLLRGRAGTEHLALTMHSAGSPVILLDDALVAIDPSRVGTSPGIRFAAIGSGDAAPVFASLRSSGASRRPLAPVHPKISLKGDETWRFGWTRRARGQWHWDDWIDVPMVEEREEYLVGYGPEAAPFSSWLTQSAHIDFSPASRAALLDAHGSADLWVRQSGTYSKSPALRLGRFF
ncbi:MAG: phage tail protein [Erythrobacter sp.]|uniref:GTA baseplate fiber-binding domain-containing protein n=1 Tax=Erythrobacter sp. TaxID=1042 RepID=UPI0032EE3CD3